MKTLFGLIIFNSFFTSSVALAQQSLVVVFPPNNHQTSTEKIFFLGTAPSPGQINIHGKVVKRSQAGHLAPSLPLKKGENIFTLHYQNQEHQIKITKLFHLAELPQELGFTQGSLTPAQDITRLPGELICFSAIAPPQAQVTVQLANQTVNLTPQPFQAQLPANSSVLTGRNQPTVSIFNNYQGCTTVTQVADLGKPEFRLTLNDQTITQAGTGKITILSPAELPVAEVTSELCVTRTGPSADYSRLSPLPKGTRATITGKEGDWLRLDYGAWINSKETKILKGAMPTATKGIAPQTVIRSLGYRQLAEATEILFPLQLPVPVNIEQGNNSLTLTLYNTIAQKDTIRLDDNPMISRLDWQQISPQQVRYTFNLKNSQQWGYKLRYDNTTLVLSLRHPPNLHNRKNLPLSGIKILLDPGHGGKESGSRGQTGYLAKDVNLTVAKLLRDELVQRGAKVVMTREDDRDISLVERQEIINQEEPTISLSLHYNFLPYDPNTEKTRGLMSFWYHPQAHNPTIFLHNYLVKKLPEPTYGIFWNNLALTRPSAAPAVLLEFRVMNNSSDFEQVINPQQQRKTAKTLADGVTEWFKLNLRRQAKE